MATVMSNGYPEGYKVPEASEASSAEAFRYQVRNNNFHGTSTSGFCPGFAQANLLILPAELAGDFRLLCSRNPVPCPIIAETPIGDPMLPAHIAAHCDIRTDIPRYNIYEDGVLVETVTDIKEEWRSDHIAFLIGCSYSFEAALKAANLPPRHEVVNRNVPMYCTSSRLLPAGSFGGNMVVSMRPYKKDDLERVRSITRPFTATHGEPVAWGASGVVQLGISDLHKPDFGDAPELREDEIPVFWGCGVTPQLAVMQSKIEGRVISHHPGFMLVLDLKDADVCSL